MKNKKRTPAILDIDGLLAHLKRNEGWVTSDPNGDIETPDGLWLCELHAEDNPRYRAWLEYEVDGQTDQLVCWDLFVISRSGGKR